MKQEKLSDMVRGWFVGDFEPSVLRTGDVEVGVQHYQAGDTEARHHHKIATEITVLVSGSARMGDRVLVAGDIVCIEPGESTDFEALEDTVVAVVKLPGAREDKYPGRAGEAEPA